MDLSDAVKRRRSVRKFEPKPVPHELVEEVLVAAGWAPSAHNAQPWRFIVLEDAAAKRGLAEAMAKAWAADITQAGVSVEAGKFKLRVERFAAAPVLILGCISMEDMIEQPDAESQGAERDLAVQSLGAAIQNLLLAAHDVGLGACWFCAPAFCKDTVREALGIPGDVEPQALIALGYPAEEPAAPPRKALGEFCFGEKWGGRF